MPVRLRIRHSVAAGSLLRGTCRGDGASKVLGRRGWRWSARIQTGADIPGAWYLPGSRNQPASRELLEQTAEALRAAGFILDVEIDDSTPSVEHLDASIAGRAPDRCDTPPAEANSERAAARREAACTAAPLAATTQIGQHLPYRHDPEKVRTRIRQLLDARARLEREAVRHRAAPTGSSDGAGAGERLARLAEHAAVLTGQLQHWTSIHLQQIAEDAPADVTADDLCDGPAAEVAAEVADR